MKLGIIITGLTLSLGIAAGCSSVSKPVRTTQPSATTGTVRDVLADPQFKEVVAALSNSGGY